MDASPARDIFDPTFVKGIFQDLAGKYWVNDFSSLGLANRWRELAIRAALLPQGAAVCDLMTGTGEALPLLLKFIGSEGRVVAVDFSGRMLAQAHERIKRLGAGNVSLVEEGIFSCSLPDGSFDAVTCTFGAKLIPIWQWTAFADLIARLLRPGGRFILLELGVPQSPVLRRPHELFVHQVIPGVGNLLSGASNGFDLLGEYTKTFEGFGRMHKVFEAMGLQAEVQALLGGCGSLLRGTKPALIS